MRRLRETQGRIGTGRCWRWSRRLGIDDIDYYRDFARRVESVKTRAARRCCGTCKARANGSPPTGRRPRARTLINYVGIGTDLHRFRGRPQRPQAGALHARPAHPDLRPRKALTEDHARLRAAAAPGTSPRRSRAQQADYQRPGRALHRPGAGAPHRGCGGELRWARIWAQTTVRAAARRGWRSSTAPRRADQQLHPAGDARRGPGTIAGDHPARVLRRLRLHRQPGLRPGAHRILGPLRGDPGLFTHLQALPPGPGRAPHRRATTCTERTSWKSAAARENSSCCCASWGETAGSASIPGCTGSGIRGPAAEQVRFVPDFYSEKCTGLPRRISSAAR